MTPDITVVLPCGDDDGITACVKSIDDTAAKPLAVLNGASTQAHRAVEAARIDALCLPVRNLGAACDEGCRMASTDLVLLMNTDCTFAPGAVTRLRAAWRPGVVVRARLRFEGASWVSHVVETLQDYQSLDPVRAYQPGILFDRSIRALIGHYFFDRDIGWTEDADFDRRCRAGGIEIVYVEDAIIWHTAPTLRGKLRSAFRYGVGRSNAEFKRLIGTQPRYRLSAGTVLREAVQLGGQHDTATAAYSVAWNLSFSAGVYWRRLVRLSEKWGSTRRMAISGWRR